MIGNDEGSRLERQIERAAVDDHVGDALAGTLAAGLTGIRRREPDAVHQRGPFLVVISGPARRAEMVLLEMDHFVDQRRQRLRGRTVLEVLHVERDLVADLVAVGGFKHLTMEEAARLAVLAYSDQAIRQFAAEQPLVEVGIGLIEALIGLPGRSGLRLLGIWLISLLIFGA